MFTDHALFKGEKFMAMFDDYEEHETKEIKHLKNDPTSDNDLQPESELDVESGSSLDGTVK